MNNLQVIEVKGQRVLTTKQLAENYETTEKIISNNFNYNKEKYIENKHFYCLKGYELKTFLQSLNSGLQNSEKIRVLYLWTERGTLLHAKSLNTDKAWQVYDYLIEHYFRTRQTQPQSLIEYNDKIQNVEKRVEKLEDTMTIDYGQQNDLRMLGNSVVVSALGGYESKAYKAMGKKVFARLWKDYKIYFKVNSYKNTPRKKYFEAKDYIINWQPDANTSIMIKRLNAQMEVGALA